MSFASKTIYKHELPNGLSFCAFPACGCFNASGSGYDKPQTCVRGYEMPPLRGFKPVSQIVVPHFSYRLFETPQS